MESLALGSDVGEPIASVDATKCTPSTDPGLTPDSAALPGSVLAAIPDDRPTTMSEMATLLNVPKSAVYSACDGGDLQYVKLEGAVQVEDRDLKAWLTACHRIP